MDDRIGEDNSGPDMLSKDILRKIFQNWYRHSGDPILSMTLRGTTFSFPGIIGIHGFFSSRNQDVRRIEETRKLKDNLHKNS